MRKLQQQLAGAILCSLLSLWVCVHAQRSGRRSGGAGLECPRQVPSPKQLAAALSCPRCGCDTLLLQGNGVLYNFVPDNPFPGGTVLGNWTIQGSHAAILQLNSTVGRLEIQEGYWVEFQGLSLASRLKAVEEGTFLIPEPVSLGKGSGLTFVDSYILTDQSTVEKCINYAVENLPKNSFKVVKDERNPSIVSYLEVLSWGSSNVRLKSVVIKSLVQPKVVKDRSVQRLVVTHSKGLLKALDIASTSGDEFAHVDIVNDIVLSKEDWTYASVRVGKNISISGVRASKMPLLDVSLINSAVLVVPHSRVELEGLELFNLAPGDLTKGLLTNYAAHLWFFLSDRRDLKVILVKNSRLVLSCIELSHFERAIAKRPSPSFEDSMWFDLKGTVIVNGSQSSQGEAGSRVIHLEFARGYGVHLSNVTLTCEPPPQGRLLDFNSRLVAPEQRLGGGRDLGDGRILGDGTSTPGPTPPPRPNRRPRRHKSGEEEESNSTFVIFKVVLALLVPVFLLLVGGFGWRLYKLRVQVNEMYSNEDSKSIGLTGTNKGPARKGGGEDMPATCSSDRTTGQLTSSKLASWDIRRNQHATEFIPDIMAVAENIDDKQLVLLELLGQGSSGTVHKGLWRELSVAVKTIIFRSGQRDSQERQQAAIREVAITSGLTHPNVVCTYSYDVKRLMTTVDNPQMNSEQVGMWDDFSDWKLYIIQEYCDGGSLKKGLEAGCLMDKKYGGPDLEKGLEIASGIARGVHHIHTKNIIHGDLKPNNVLLKKTDKNRSGLLAKIADFGLSLKMHGSQTHVSNVQGGTPFYMAPEVLECGSAGKAADVYAFGVILWEMYMSHFSSTGVPTPHALSAFPKLPWSCPVLYSVLTVACMRADPTQRPSFQDILDVLSHMWHQLRQRTMIAPAQSRVSSHGSEFNFDPEDLEAAKAAYKEALSVMSPKFRDISFQQVYWCQKC